ncbi:thioesterase [Actinomadura spongiicola]|uniref:Thioesterase n=1 Tax=Actinomadura spongiicola TaxID=2303421 RepID=A0A372GG28_9ACTN|nr:alpha/beta fold hydrolase [Actinomadura spongiicola]RFS84324.1 thioesterase [Actinomadura spongiicola]
MPNERWLLSHELDPRPPVRIHCFPAAGVDPRSLLEWQPLLGDAAQVTVVCLPGRWHRADEPPPASLTGAAETVAEEIATADDRPYLLFGHSMGAVLAFEAARRLSGRAEFRHLVVSGSTAPRHNPSEYILWADGRHGRPFAEAAARFLGLPAEFGAAPEEVQDLLLADLRADVGLFAAYRYEEAPPLVVPLSVICGRDDPHVDLARVQDWRRESAVPAQIHWVEGDHFYLDHDPSAVLDTLRPLVRGEHVEVI